MWDVSIVMMADAELLYDKPERTQEDTEEQRSENRTSRNAAVHEKKGRCKSSTRPGLRTGG